MKCQDIRDNTFPRQHKITSYSVITEPVIFVTDKIIVSLSAM